MLRNKSFSLSSMRMKAGGLDADSPGALHAEFGGLDGFLVLESDA